MILDEIVEDKKKRLPGHMARIPETEMRRMAEETKTREADCFYNHLKKSENLRKLPRVSERLPARLI